MTKTEKISVNEAVVIYFSDEDGVWVANGLRTDQIGTGDSPLEALTDQLRGVDAVCELASEDESLAHLRAAPKEIQDMYARAKRLPYEIYEIAHKMARGEWPGNVKVEIEDGQDALFYTELQPC